MGDSGVGQHREQLAQRGGNEFVSFEDMFGVSIDAGAEQVGHASSPKRQPVVLGALTVDHEIAVVGEGRAGGETDLVKD